ncbi:MAG: hypothetical protein HZB91_13665, partial [Elusimicrobia bacterium]|nr:hypothetical protein [Elusimicrobiota bacterium]
MSRIYCDLDCLRYHTPGHPDTPERVGDTAERLRLSGRVLRTPDQTVSAVEVALAHDPLHLGMVADGL